MLEPISENGLIVSANRALLPVSQQAVTPNAVLLLSSPNQPHLHAIKRDRPGIPVSPIC